MASNLTVPALTLRNVKGSPLTSTEIDNNFKILSSFCNSLSSLIGQSLQSDGTLNDGAVGTSALQDRSVPASALKLNSLPVFEDSGSANAYVITPNPAATAYENGMIFFIRAGNTNTGTSSLNVNGLGAVQINLYGTASLTSGQIVADGIFCVVYLDGVFLMLGSASSSSTTTTTAGGTTTTTSGGTILNSSALATTLVQFSPAAVSLPGAALNASFSHNMGVVPMIVSAYLSCKIAELGFAVGDMIPIDNFFDSSGRPAFGIDVNSTTIVVTQNVAPPVVNQRSSTAGTATAITPGNWSLVVMATAGGQQNSATLSPPLEIMMSNPSGAISYGTNLYAVSYSSLGGSWPMFHQIDLTTSKIVTSIAPDSTNMFRCNAAMFRLSDNLDRAIFTSSSGTYTFFLNSPVAITKLWANDSHNQKPVYADFSAGTVSAVYAMDSSVNSGNGIKAIQAFLLNGSGRAVYGTVSLNLFDANIVNGAAFQALHNTAVNYSQVMISWNPVKRRLYVVDVSNYLLHIFQMTDSNLDWKGWWVLASSTTKHADLTYVKSVAIGGSVTNGGDDSFLYGSVEFDLISGLEKAVCFTNSNSSNAAGTIPGKIVRIPWREG